MDTSSEKVLEFLRRHQEDRGIMANLKCALVENKRRRTWPILACYGGIGDDFKALTVQYLAGFFASHPKECYDGNFGDSCRRLMDDEEKSVLEQGNIGPLSRRFQHLLASEGEEIFDRVMRLLMRCKTKEISINYAQLFQDLSQWQKMPDAIRNDWARSFWAPKSEDKS